MNSRPTARTQGDKLWSFKAGTTIMPGPVSYAVDGEQYIAVLAGRGGGSGLVGGPMARRWQGVVNENRVLAFKLNGEAELPAPRRIEQAADVRPSCCPQRRTSNVWSAASSYTNSTATCATASKR